MLIALVLVLAVGFYYLGLQNTVDNMREGCERQNVIASRLLNNTLDDARTRRDAAPGIPGAAGRDVAAEARQGFRDADNLIDSVAPVAEKKGSVITDCAKAFPGPTPFG